MPTERTAQLPKNQYDAPWTVEPTGDCDHAIMGSTPGQTVGHVYDPEQAQLVVLAPELLGAAVAYRNHLRTAAHTDEQVRTYEHLCDLIHRAGYKAGL